MSHTDDAPIKNLSVVIPVYDSESVLPGLAQRLGTVLQSYAPHYELILVNDGNVDNGWEVICRLAKEHGWGHGIDLMCYYGQHNALPCGIQIADGDVVVPIDDDLQHPPKVIPDLLATLGEGRYKCGAVRPCQSFF